MTDRRDFLKAAAANLDGNRYPERFLQSRREEYWIPWGNSERTSSYPIDGWRVRWTEWEDVPFAAKGGS